MTFTTVLPGLYGLTTPTPFQPEGVNAYLAEGDQLTLIDGGVGTDEAYQALVGELAELGYRISDIQRLLITHHHTDHKGLAQRIVEQSGAAVWCHPNAVRWLETPREERVRLNQFSGHLFREGGVPQEIIDILAQVDEYLESMSGVVKVHTTIDEGQTLELAGCQWRVYFTPGHAGDLICMYQPESRVLLSSDHILGHVSSNPLIEAPQIDGDPRPQRLIEYLREMQRMAELDIEIAYPGHGTPVTEIKALVESRGVFHNSRADKLLALFEGKQCSLYELTKLMFPKVHATQSFLTLSEVQGHIDILVHDGRLRDEMYDGLRYWQPTIVDPSR
jgi:glyoxylase-like metal-dependent hydrolase (beta-lactamase superfamily II)